MSTTTRRRPGETDQTTAARIRRFVLWTPANPYVAAVVAAATVYAALVLVRAFWSSSGEPVFQAMDFVLVPAAFLLALLTQLRRAKRERAR
ncbi:hypothetical protein GL263_13925 [Streptomyces durbertensis]|uniref:Integral membrane protein n=1 Tax=Streptomyces durbertensis TaxID=2448886 RepID=A0ABR6EH49_9ACTN|nr:hypothetical protein [Streptomyces durbertensis]MBB1244655.1 hypothetical protein [Streptomyces durbertensis]